MEEHVVPLLVPVKLGDMEYASLTLSEPTYKQLTQAGKQASPMEQLGTLIQLNAKVPMAVVEQLRQRDLEACGSFFAHFSDASPATLETSSQS
jgi:hypothetical protein